MEVRYVVIAAWILCWLGGAVSWAFAAYYMVKTMYRFHPERRWGRYMPLSIFMPYFFTDEGNSYRVKLLRATGLFMLFLGATAAISYGIERLADR